MVVRQPATHIRFSYTCDSGADRGWNEMRFLYHLCRGWLNPSPRSTLAGPFAAHIFKTRAGLFDIDVNLHLNNASLILATEFARWNFIGGTELAKAAFKNKWAFMIGSQAVRYRHEIRAFKAYEIKTEIVAADESWLWLRHTVHAENRTCAHVLARVIVKEGRKTVPPSEILRLIGVDATKVVKPSESKEVTGFLEWDADVNQQMKMNN